jgi:hypothetical protein
MEKCRHIIYKLLIILISVVFIDGGRSLVLVSSNIQVLINKEHTSDSEIPHQHNLPDLSNEEKWIESLIFDFSCFNFKSVSFLYSLNTDSQEFPDSIWQPPKFV